MRRLTMAVAAAAMAAGTILTAPTAAAGVVQDTTYTQPSVPTAPTTQPLDCQGTTGNMGCGPGWFWRDGWRGWACYPC